MSVTSLLRYLSQRLLLLALLVSIGMSYMLYNLYNWGLDDSTEYYLWQDVLAARQSLADEAPLPLSNDFKQYYLIDKNQADLWPAAYQSEIKKALKAALNTEAGNKPFSHYFYQQTMTSFRYGVIAAVNAERYVLVVHNFQDDEQNITGLSLLEVAALSTLSLIVIMSLGAWLIYVRLARAIKQMKRNALPDSKHRKEYLPTGFSELDAVTSALRQAIEQLEDKRLQEKKFIQTLSHELRTPMATIQVATEIMSQILKKSADELPSDVAQKLQNKTDVVFNSNHKMQHLASELLSLWKDSDQSVTASPQMLDISVLLAEVLAELDQAYQCQQRFVVNSALASGSVWATVGKDYASLLLHNVLKNAVVHSQGTITIDLDEQGMTISNAKADQDSDAMQQEPDLAGFGLGLMIAGRAAELLAWTLEISDTPEQYQIQITFYSGL